MESAGLKKLSVPEEYMHDKVLAHDLVNTETGEIVAKANDTLTPDRRQIPDRPEGDPRSRGGSRVDSGGG